MGKVDALVEDILLASLDRCILDGEAQLPRDGAALASLAERKRGDWAAHAERLARLTLEILKHWHGLQKRSRARSTWPRRWRSTTSRRSSPTWFIRASSARRRPSG